MPADKSSPCLPVENEFRRSIGVFDLPVERGRGRMGVKRNHESRESHYRCLDKRGKRVPFLSGRRSRSIARIICEMSRGGGGGAS